jgi:hypothetical protein
MKSILDVSVSCFRGFFDPDNTKSVNLLIWLTSTKYANQVGRIRSISDKTERNKIKATLPAITPSGLFTRRGNTALIRHSGLICLDVDQKDNEDIPNYSALKDEFSKIANVAYAGLSVSGAGFFVLIPIAFPEQHTAQFNALRNLFEDRYEITVDSTGDVSRLRGYSYDPDAYFNHQATPFKGMCTPPPSKPATTTYNRSTISSEVNPLPSLLARVAAANEGDRHNVLLKESRLAGGFIAAGRIDEATVIDSLESVAANWPNQDKSNKTIRDGIKNGKESPIPANTFVGSVCTSPKRFDNESSVYSGTITEQKANPGSILRPDLSLLTRMPIVDCNSYPAKWDESTPPGAIPTIKQTPIQQYLRN